MGLISGLLTLPLAPVRGTAWLAEMIQAQAERETDEGAALLVNLAELESAREQGQLSDAELDEAENEIVERLLAIRGYGEQESYGV